MKLSLQIPPTTIQGEYVYGVIQLKNDGSEPITLRSRLNILEDLQIIFQTPDKASKRIESVLINDFQGPEPKIIKPGNIIEGNINLFYHRFGHIYSTYGNYIFYGQIPYYSDKSGPILAQIPQVSITVNPPIKKEERELAELTMNDEVGRSISLCEAENEEQLKKLLQISKNFPKSNIGIVSNLIIGNTLTYGMPDLKDEFLIQNTQNGPDEFFKAAFRERPLKTITHLTCSLVPYNESVPMIKHLREHIRNYTKLSIDDITQTDTTKILEDHFLH